MNAVATTEQSLIPAATTALGFGSSQGFEQLQRAAKLLASSTLVPKEYQGNLPNCVIALNMANRIGADPLLVMQNLYLVHGRPGWSATFLIATFNQCGRFSAMRFEFISEQGKPDWGCCAWATEKSTGERIEGSWITMTMAKAEGWIDKAGSKWKTMPQQMLQYRAASFLVRAFAPELSMGLQTQDELQDIGELKTVSVTQASRTPETLQQIEQELTGTPTGDEPQRAATGPDITAQEIHDAIANATDKDALDAAVDLVSLLPKSEQKPLYDLGTVAAGKFSE
jgi:hypothetical protein